MNNELIYEDGQVTAYDLRAGETFTPPETLVAPFMRLIFDPQGKHIATVYSVEGEEQLVFYNDPSDPLPCRATSTPTFISSVRNPCSRTWHSTSRWIPSSLVHPLRRGRQANLSVGC